MSLSKSDHKELAEAKSMLEKPRTAAKLSNLIGMPLEKGMAMLPADWQNQIQQASSKALIGALRTAVVTLPEQQSWFSGRLLHKVLAAGSGAVGGAFGLPAMLIELPVSTTLMMRSIAEIAQENGENPQDLETQLNCMQVFAFGGASSDDDDAETGYLAVRAGLAKTVAAASRHLAQKGLAQEGSPAIVNLIARIASRFSIPVSQKAAAQAVPLIGAAGGAMVNTLFMNHFQDMSKGHFCVRRLERKYGVEVVRLAYKKISES